MPAFKVLFKNIYRIVPLSPAFQNVRPSHMFNSDDNDKNNNNNSNNDNDHNNDEGNEYHI